MNKIHAKSQCCHARIWQHGARRRYCSGCGRTWSLRQKRRGRKRNRCTGQALLRYFKSGNSNLSAYRLRQELKYFLAYTQWQTVPSGQLIVIADAFYARVAKRRFTAYITLLRPVNGTEAVILPPTMHEGVETYMGWRSHFATLPKSVSRRLVAGVCDGRTGLIALFRERNLLLQRCHFHFIARLQIKRSKRRSSHHYEEGLRLYNLAKVALTASTPVAQAARRELANAARTAPRGLKTVLSGFVLNYEDYRTYRSYRYLMLPTTTGAAESLIGSIRGLLCQLRGVRTRTAFEKWINAYLKYRRTIRCNSPQNY